MTLRETLLRRRESTIYSSNEEVAGIIWSKINEAFLNINKLELELYSFVTISVTENIDYIEIGITVKDKDIECEEYTISYKQIKMSLEKLSKLNEIMKQVMEIAKENEIFAWRDEVGSFWGFHVQLE